MKNFLKQNWFKLVFILFVLLFFYWYEFRPTNIRKGCFLEVQEKTKETDKKTFQEWGVIYDVVYKSCLNKKGLEK
jgi:hypothetical protein